MKIVFNPISGRFDYINDGTLSGSGTATRLAFWNGTSDLSSDAALYWDNTNKRLGVNTVSPGERLDVSGNISVNTTGGTKIGFNTTDAFTAYSYSAAHYGISYNNTNNPLVLSGYFGIGMFTAGLERMHVTSTGNVGIGATVPSQRLTVGNSDSDAILINVGGRLYFRDTSTYINEGSGLNIVSGATRSINLSAGGSERVRILSTGQVAIGQTTASFQLHVNGTIGSTSSITATGIVSGSSYNGVNTDLNTFRNNLGNPTVEEMALFHGQFANKFRFIPPTLQEESTDGVNWTTSTRATTNQLGDLMIGQGQITNFNAIPADTIGVYGGYRLTWDVVGITGYIFLNNLYVYNSTNGNNVTVKIERFHNTTGWETVASGNANTWPGHTSVRHTSIPYSSSASQYGKVRVSFETTHNAFANPFTLYAIEWFGGYFANKRNAESYDRDRNVTFPAAISGTRLISTVATGTAPFSVNSTTVSGNLNADMVDGYHSTSLWRSDGGVWNPNANITLTQTANNQEWSFDITRNGYTGGHWHVWDSNNSTMLKVDAVTGKVSAPYNFVGNLEGNSTTATTLQTARTLTIGSTGKTFNGSADVSWSLAEIGAQAVLTNPVTGTGTTNYVSKWTSGSALGNSQVFDDGTYVGIGTAMPMSKLHVVGTLLAENTLSFNGVASIYQNSNSNLVINNPGWISAGKGINITAPSGAITIQPSTLFGTYFTAGNVGIGTTSPSYKLDIDSFSDSNVARFYSSDNNYATLLIGNTDDIVTSFYLQVDNGNAQIYKYGSGWGSETGLLSVYNSSGDIVFQPGGTTRFAITSAGNVGIGTTGPGAKLDVAGTIRQSSVISSLLKTNASGDLVAATAGTDYQAVLTNPVTGTGTATRIAYWSGTNTITSTSNLYWDNTNARLGIGTTAPSAKVHLVEGTFVTRFLVGQSTFTGYNSGLTAGQKGNIIVGQANSTNNAYVINFIYQGSSSTTNTIGLGFYNNDDIMTISAGKNVAIATTPNTAYTLTVGSILGGTGTVLTKGSVKIETGALGVGVDASATAGRIDASNDIVPFSSSDLRLKENIQNITDPIEKIKKLNGIEFDWIEEFESAHGYTGHDTGVIAQEVQEVLPTAVRTNASGYLAVRYEKLIGLLIEAVKEQQTQIDDLKSKLDGFTS